jgi:DNA repair exonuclease SbcCD ATPase subunit
MIKVERILIQEFRGVRDLTVDLKGANFAVCGPNGTGKSGIVDALEFALTGNISRLSGKGTGGLSVKEHGPHVDSRNRPDRALVKLDVFIPSLKVNATIERTVKDASKPKIVPNTQEIGAVFAQVEAHPEFVLSRREIIRYVLSEPGRRSKEVQALLRLEQVELLRASLQKIANASEKELTPLARTRSQAQDALCRAFGIAQLATATLLAAVNPRRATLGLAPILELTATTSIKDGVATGAVSQPQRVSKVQATADLAALKALLDRLVGDEMQAAQKAALQAVLMLSANPAIADGVAREGLLKNAIALFDEKECPVCATPWEPAKFKEVVARKLNAFDDAAAQRAEAEKLITPLDKIVSDITNALALCIRCAKQLVPPSPAPSLDGYLLTLGQISKRLTDFLHSRKLGQHLKAFASFQRMSRKLLELCKQL